jgi:hypothetical protein
MRAFWEKKKEVKMVKLQQFGSLREVKCHFLNTGCQSAIGWIVYGVKCIFPKKKKKKKKLGWLDPFPWLALGVVRPSRKAQTHSH